MWRGGNRIGVQDERAVGGVEAGGIFEPFKLLFELSISVYKLCGVRGEDEFSGISLSVATVFVFLCFQFKIIISSLQRAFQFLFHNSHSFRFDTKIPQNFAFNQKPLKTFSQISNYPKIQLLQVSMVQGPLK